jgi:hypothetical protein
MTSGVNSIAITFPSDTTITDSDIADSEVTVNSTGVTAADVTVVGRVATIVVPANIPAGSMTVVFLETANVKNPSTAGSYTLKVHTDLEPTDVTSAAYSITNPPGPVDVWNAATPSVYVESKTTIADAITVSSNGYTIKVHPGTYSEKNLRKTGDVSLTIQSLTGLKTGTGSAADTIITAADLAGSSDYILAVADGTGTADALTVKGLTITSTTPLVAGIPQGVGVRIHSDADAGSSLTLTNCVISNFGWGVATELPNSEISVTNSTISGCNHGVPLWQPAKLTLTGSTIIGNLGSGVLVELDNTSKDILIYKNTFQDNNSLVWGAPASAICFTGGTGKMNATWSSTNAISYNNFINNGLGIENAYGFAVPAKYNWWGNISGPSAGDVATTTAKGSGDKILDNDTDFEPWLTVPYAEAYTNNIRYYGALLPLDEGWNTLSVPLALKSDANTLQQIVGLGTYIVSSGTSQNYAGGYYYDATAGLWQPLTGSYQFAPCKAVYVKMLADANFPILYSGQFSLPSLSLPAGWNLIGSAFGIDKTNGDYGIAASNDSDGWKVVKTALASLGANASVVVSPSVPGQEAAWGTVATDDSTHVIVGEGYWVFMTAPATYAGFEVTPLYFVFP